MDFAFSEEQQMLREQARSFVSNKFGDERVVELADSGKPFDPAAWKEMAELGWIGLSLPEDKGGAGFGFIEEAVLFEELGRGLYPGPYFSTVALALPALEDAPEPLGRVLSGEAAATLALIDPAGGSADLQGLATKAEESNGSWVLVGEERLIPDAGAATEIVVVASTAEGPALFLVSRAEVEPSQTMDQTRPLGRITFNQTPATLLVDAGRAPDVLHKIRLRAEAALALEAVGIGQRALDLAIAYTSERKQFEKPIGSYQAVAHQVANIYVDLELSRSLAYWAAWCVAESDERVEIAVAAAQAHASETAVLACERSIQVHGGIGFTWEHVLHRYYKRAQWIKAFSPPATHRRAAIASHLLDA
jgi:alkylation response protein AidB-like acyl-CoA dehydrogenase